MTCIHCGRAWLACNRTPCAARAELDDGRIHYPVVKPDGETLDARLVRLRIAGSR